LDRIFASSVAALLQCFSSVSGPSVGRVDLSSSDAISSSIGQTVARFGTVDVVVNNAGYGMEGTVEELDEKKMRAIFEINIYATIHVTRFALPYLRKQKSGHIVGISTVLADQPLAGAPISLPVITKSTIPAFSRALAMEYVADGIRANSISPGVVDTPMHANDNHEELKKLSPTPRLVQISEIVDALFYLQSAPMVNGENIRIDGGAHAGAKW